MDPELKTRLAAGQPAAFEQLYDELADRLYRFLRLRLPSPEDAADVLQTTFVCLVRSRQRLAAADNLAAFVFRVAGNEAARLLARRPFPAGSVELELHGADDAQLAHQDAVDQARVALARLTDEQREVVQLRHYADLTFQQIAEVTGLPAGTVATRYRAALRVLRTWMAEETS